MPTVYLAAQNDGTPLPAFRSKGIPNMMPGVVSDTPVTFISGIVATPASAFRYIYAALLQQVFIMTSSPVFVNIFKPLLTVTSLFDAPIASIRFDKLSKEQDEELRAMGLAPDLSSKNIFVGTPNFAQISRINAIGPIGDRVRPGHVNFEGILAWSYLMKGLHIFLSTKKFLKPQSTLNMTTADEGLDADAEGNITAINGEVVKLHNKSVFDVTENSDLLGFNGADVVIPMEGDAIVAGDGSFSSTSNGIFFPFFTGMSVPDKHVAFLVFRSLFFGTLASTEALNVSILNRIRVGIKSLAYSRAGLALSHIYFLIGASLQIPGSRVRIVLKGSSYVGTVIEGDFSVYLFGQKVVSAPYSEDIRKIDLLGQQQKELCGILNGLENENGSRPYNFVEADFATSRLTLQSWYSVDKDLFASTDLKDKALEIIQAMEFNDIFPVVTPKALTDFITFLSNGNRDLLKEYPAYLFGSVVNNSSRVYEGLSMFGPKCPSISTGDKKSLVFTIPAPGKEDPNLSVNETTKKRALQYIPVWLVPLGQAAQQWNLVLSSGKLCFPTPRKGKKEFVNTQGVLFEISEKAAFESHYSLIKGAVKTGKSEPKGGKRKNRNEDEAEKDRAKKVRNALELAEI